MSLSQLKILHNEKKLFVKMSKEVLLRVSSIFLFIQSCCWWIFIKLSFIDKGALVEKHGWQKTLTIRCVGLQQLVNVMASFKGLFELRIVFKPERPFILSKRRSSNEWESDQKIKPGFTWCRGSPMDYGSDVFPLYSRRIGNQRSRYNMRELNAPIRQIVSR